MKKRALSTLVCLFLASASWADGFDTGSLPYSVYGVFHKNTSNGSPVPYSDPLGADDLRNFQKDIFPKDLECVQRQVKQVNGVILAGQIDAVEIRMERSEKGAADGDPEGRCDGACVKKYAKEYPWWKFKGDERTLVIHTVSTPLGADCKTVDTGQLQLATFGVSAPKYGKWFHRHHSPQLVEEMNPNKDHNSPKATADSSSAGSAGSPSKGSAGSAQ